MCSAGSVRHPRGLSNFMTISMRKIERRKKFSRARVRHGMHDTPEYAAWLSMRHRCKSPWHPCYRLYGARGITVCEEWYKFENFFRDMGKRPHTKSEIERKNNKKGYSKDNCVWSDRYHQMRNTRRTIRITIFGETLCLKDWCQILEVPYHTALSRVRNGWSELRALLEPINDKYRNHRGQKHE